jgi:hypothetical protein
MSYKVTAVSREHVRNIWKHAKPWLQPAVEMSGGRWTIDYILAALVLGEQTLWVVLDDDGKIVGAATTELVSYPEITSIAVHFLGGENFEDFWHDLFIAMRDLGISRGCKMIECNARFGFWKWFKKEGMHKTSAFYELRID